MSNTNNNNDQRKEVSAQEVNLDAEQMLGVIPVTPPVKDKEHEVPVVWRIFGGAIFSIIFLLTVTIFGYIITQVNNVQSSVQTLNGEVVKKPEFDQRNTAMWSHLKTVDPLCNRVTVLEQRSPALDTLKEKFSATDQQIKGLEQHVKTLADENKALQKDVQLLRERLAVLEAQVNKK